jgi:integrase
MATVIDRWVAEPDKRNGKRWQVRWRDDQKKYRRRGFERKADADRFATRIEHELNSGSYRDPREGDIPFNEYATIWLRSQVQLRPSTQNLYEGALRNHLEPFLGATPLNRITPETGRKLLALNGPRRSKEIATQLLKRILRDATNERLLAHNPLQSLKVPKTHTGEARFLTLTEVENLVANTNPHFQTLIRSAAVLGMRQGELFGLHPDNLDLDRRQVRVVEQLIAHPDPPQRGELKTKASKRTVAIPSFMLSELHEQLTQRASSDYVFTAVQGGPIRKSTFLRRYWKPAVTASGIEGLRFHELRHTAAAIAIQAGAHPKAIQARLGHSSITVTLDRYGHLMPGTDQTVADGIDQLVAVERPLTSEVVPHPAAGLG